MTAKRGKFQPVLIKRFYTPKESAVMHGVTVEKVLELAYPIGAVYEIKKSVLVNEGIIQEYINKGLGFELICDADYMPYLDALKKSGIKGKEFEVLAYRAKSVYKVGTALYVNVNEFTNYMKYYQQLFKYGTEENE